MIMLTCLFRSSVMREIWIFFLPMAATIYSSPRSQIEMFFSRCRCLKNIFGIISPPISNSLVIKYVFCRLAGASFMDAKGKYLPQFLQLRSRNNVRWLSVCHHQPARKNVWKTQWNVFLVLLQLQCDQFNLVIVILCKFWNESKEERHE